MLDNKPTISKKEKKIKNKNSMKYGLYHNPSTEKN